jgi:hypothetical protein
MDECLFGVAYDNRSLRRRAGAGMGPAGKPSGTIYDPCG